MISLIDVLQEINSDFDKDEYRDVGALSRRFTLSGGITITVSLYKKDQICEVGVVIPDDITPELLNSLPKWKGMEERSSIVSDAERRDKYLFFKQLEGYDAMIFIKVMQDVIDGLGPIVPKQSVNCIKSILQKWSTFFRFENDYVLSEIAQQGLYGELWVLDKMIDLKGQNAFSCWTGYNSETHDFYFGKDAAEIKSTSSKGPERVIIHSEYQLDDVGIEGNLYLICLHMKKSIIDGQSLPELVMKIYEKLDLSLKPLFIDNLLKVGYVFSLPQLYTVCFKIRKESCFVVKDGFPRITTKSISQGIGSVEYAISLDACRSFMVENETFYREVDFK